MIKQLFFLCIALFVTQVTANNIDRSTKELEPLYKYFKPELVYINETQLPKMQAEILTQPLLTPAIADYYQRTPKIRSPLKVDEDLQHKTFYRAIVMIVDNNKKRDDALEADRLNESMIVEMGLISIDFSALPKKVVEGVRGGQTPFGTLLLENKVDTHSINTRYFKVACDQQLAHDLKCETGQILYGRSNTIVRDDDHAHIAHVVEILTGS